MKFTLTNLDAIEKATIIYTATGECIDSILVRDTRFKSIEAAYGPVRAAVADGWAAGFIFIEGTPWRWETWEFAGQ